MKYQYYSTFPEGLVKVIKKIIIEGKYADEVINEGSSFVVYSTNKKPEEISKIQFFETTFLLVEFFNQNHYISNQIRWIANNPNKVFVISKSISRKDPTFRVVESRNSGDKKKYVSQIKKVEMMLSQKIAIDRGHPDFEIRLVEKSDYGFIGFRITNPPEYFDLFQRGSIRKEIAYVLNYLSNPERDDVFIDPFCGSGIIPLLRSQMAAYSKIIASDRDTSFLKDKMQSLNIKKNNFIVKRSNIETLKLDNTLVNKIVTDPPWGLIQAIPDLDKFYQETLRKFLDICTSNARVVIISSSEYSVLRGIKCFGGTIRLVEKLAIKASGRKTFIFVLNINK